MHPVNGPEESDLQRLVRRIKESNEIIQHSSSDDQIPISPENKWDPQLPTLADNTSTNLVDSRSTDSQAPSISDQANSSPPANDDDGSKLVIDGPDVTAIESLIDDISNGINKVANQLSHGLSFDKDSKEESVDNHSQKSVSSLESDMTAKLAQPSLVPPDIISNWYTNL